MRKYVELVWVSVAQLQLLPRHVRPAKVLLLVRPASLSHKRRAGLPLLVLARNPLRPAKATATVFQIQPKYMTSVMRIKMAPSLSGGPSLCAEESV